LEIEKEEISHSGFPKRYHGLILKQTIKVNEISYARIIGFLQFSAFAKRVRIELHPGPFRYLPDTNNKTLFDFPQE